MLVVIRSYHDIAHVAMLSMKDRLMENSYLDIVYRHTCLSGSHLLDIGICHCGVC